MKVIGFLTSRVSKTRFRAYKSSFWDSIFVDWSHPMWIFFHVEPSWKSSLRDSISNSKIFLKTWTLIDNPKYQKNKFKNQSQSSYQSLEADQRERKSWVARAQAVPSQRLRSELRGRSEGEKKLGLASPGETQAARGLGLADLSFYFWFFFFFSAFFFFLCFLPWRCGSSLSWLYI